jgi:hypothetical protein
VATAAEVTLTSVAVRPGCVSTGLPKAVTLITVKFVSRRQCRYKRRSGRPRRSRYHDQPGRRYAARQRPLKGSHGPSVRRSHAGAGAGRTRIGLFLVMSEIGTVQDALLLRQDEEPGKSGQQQPEALRFRNLGGSRGSDGC